MTNEEKVLIDKYLGLKEAERETFKKSLDVLKELSALAPHKVGEIVKWTERKRKNIGSWLHPSFVELPPVENRAVVTKVVADIWKWRDENAELNYKYEFKPIKKNGCVSSNLCHPNYDAIEWTGEIHKDYQNKG